MNKRKLLKRLLIAALCVVCAVVIFEIVVRVLMDSEMRSRDDWNVQVGEHQYTSEERNVSVYDAPCQASISVSRIVPDEYEEEGFTYYDEDVQQRLGSKGVEEVRPIGLSKYFGSVGLEHIADYCYVDNKGNLYSKSY